MANFDKWMRDLQKNLKKSSETQSKKKVDNTDRPAQIIQENVRKEQGGKVGDFYDNVAVELEPDKPAFKFLKSQVDQLDIMSLASDIKGKKMSTVAEEIFKTLNLDAPVVIPQSVKNDIKELIGWKFQYKRSDWEDRNLAMREQAEAKIKEIEKRYQ